MPKLHVGFKYVIALELNPKLCNRFKDRFGFGLQKFTQSIL